MRTFSIRSAAVLVALLGWIAPSVAAEPNAGSMTLGTASPGGTYYVYGEGVANILTRALDMPVVRQATEGPLENIELMEAGQIQLGFVTMGVALQAWNAAECGPAARPRAPCARSFRCTTRRSSSCSATVGNTIHRRIAGKRIGVGPHGGTSATYAPQFFSVLNVAAEFIYGDYADLATQLQNGQIDAFFAAAGAPFPSFIALRPRPRSAT